MKRITPLLLFLLSLALLASACAPQTPAGIGAITLTDGLGREVKLAAPAQRIVSLAPSNTEILFALGAGSQVVGRDDFSNYPAEASQAPSVGGSMGSYNLEQIAALKPDLVLASSLNTTEQVRSIEQLGIQIYLLPNPKDLDGLYQNLDTVGALTGRQDEAGDLVKSLMNRVEAVVSQISTVETRPLVFYELDGSDPAQPWTTGAGTFLANLIGMAGGANAGDDLTGDYAQMSLEALLVKDPDLIILGDSNYGVDASQVAAREGWGTLKAIAAGNIFAFNDDLVSRPGPRLVDGLEALAKLIHPEAFPR